MGDIMFDKLSGLNEKNEYEKIIKDYNNNYGYNVGISGMSSKESKDNFDKSVKDLLIMKKR